MAHALTKKHAGVMATGTVNMERMSCIAVSTSSYFVSILLGGDHTIMHCDQHDYPEFAQSRGKLHQLRLCLHAPYLTLN